MTARAQSLALPLEDSARRDERRFSRPHHFASGHLPDRGKSAPPLTNMSMPRDLKQLCPILGGLSYHRNFLRHMSRRIHRITSILKKGVVMFAFRPFMEINVRELLTELSAPPVLSSPIGTLMKTALALSGYTATPASMVQSVHHRVHQ